MFSIFLIRSGHCDIYRGDLCQKRKVFIPMGSRQVDIEEDLSKTLQSIRSNGFITKQCSPYVAPILCQLRFPDCDETSSSPKGKPICKDECQVLKDRYCKKEHSANLFSISFDCSSVSEYNRSSGKCAEVGVPEKDLMKGGVLYFEAFVLVLLGI